MAWNDLPTWLKSGIIGGGIFAVYSIIITIALYPFCGDMGCATTYFLMLPSMPILFLTIPLFEFILAKIIFQVPSYQIIYTQNIQILQGAVTGILQYFLLGCLIGIIIQLIKKNKK